MKKLLLFVITTAIFLSACEDKNTPEPTPDPKPYVNKFNCKINGKYWDAIPREINNSILQGNALYAEFQFKDSILWISGINKSDNEHLIVRLPFYLNTYSNIDTFNNLTTSYINFSQVNICKEYSNIDTNKLAQFIVTTKDKENKIIKGNFEFTLFSPTCKESLVITEGYFDYSFK